MEEEIVPIEPVSDEYSKVISEDLKVLINFMQEKEQKEIDLAEAEKILQSETEKQENELSEQKELEEIEQDRIALEQEQKDLEKEQLMIDSENEFRTNLVDSVNSQSEKMDTYIQKSDGLLASVNLMNENTEMLIENTTVQDTADVDYMAYFADVTLVMIVWMFLPFYIAFRMFKPFFNKFF